jgi:hypothetical protein
MPCRRASGDVLDVAHGEAVDDARPLEFGERLGQPREAFGLPVEPDRAEGETVAAQRPAERGELGAELVGDVVTTRSLAVAVQPRIGTDEPARRSTMRPMRR